MPYPARTPHRGQRWAPIIALVLTLVIHVSPVMPARAADAPAPAATTRFFPRRFGEQTPAVGLPMRVKIPKLNTDAAIESVGNASDGAMDVPKRFDDTAWYRYGARPGEAGNAVIAGHVDSTTGAAVFWNLRTLAPGDRIIVVGDDTVERAFVVTGIETYARADAPLDRVFGSTPGAHLNLITCDRTSRFDRGAESYANNLVVYADAAS